MRRGQGGTLPSTSGRAIGIAVASGGDRVYAAAANGGVWRSDDAGDTWTDISEGLPSRFGFPLSVLPHDGNTIFVVPEESDEVRITPHASFRIYRSRDRGATWHALTTGLPQQHAYMNVMRMAVATDTIEPAGVYVGTQGGHLLASRDGGDRWDVIFNWLPPIYSVETAILEV